MIESLVQELEVSCMPVSSKTMKSLLHSPCSPNTTQCFQQWQQQQQVSLDSTWTWYRISWLHFHKTAMHTMESLVQELEVNCMQVSTSKRTS